MWRSGQALLKLSKGCTWSYVRKWAWHICYWWGAGSNCQRAQVHLPGEEMLSRATMPSTISSIYLLKKKFWSWSRKGGKRYWRGDLWGYRSQRRGRSLETAVRRPRLNFLCNYRKKLLILTTSAIPFQKKHHAYHQPSSAECRYDVAFSPQDGRRPWVRRSRYLEVRHMRKQVKITNWKVQEFYQEATLSVSPMNPSLTW